MKSPLVLAVCLALPGCMPGEGQSQWATVPPMNHAVPDVKGVTLLVAAETTLEADDPVVLGRMKQNNTPVKIRDSVGQALDEAGFGVVRSRERPFDLEVLVHVKSTGSGDARQEEYRLVLKSGSAAIDEVRWVWPKDVIVALDSLADYAAHNLVNAMLDSKHLAEFAASHRKPTALAATSSAAPAATTPAGATQLVAASPQPGSYAVVIGIERYRDLPSPIGARHDAEAFAEVLHRTLGLKQEHIHLALDDRATRADVDKHLDWIKTEVPAGSRVYFYFSGHGAPEVASGSPYLLPFDGDPRMVERTGLALADVLKKIGEGRARETLAIVDTCFSGAGGRSVLPPGARPLVRVKDATTTPRVALFSATGASEISGPAPGTAEGLFTRTVVEGLGEGKADTDGDGQISLQELVEWVKPRVTREAMKDHRAQTPTLTMGGAIGSAANFIVGYGYATR